MARLINSILLLLVLFGAWIVFSGFMESFFLIAGGISCALSFYCFYRMGFIENKTYWPVYLRPKSWIYMLWLLKEMIVSAVNVAMIVLHGKMPLSPELAWISGKAKSDNGKVVYANSITLTPGTVCIDIEKNKVQVHALQKESLKDLRAGGMDKKVVRYIG